MQVRIGPEAAYRQKAFSRLKIGELFASAHTGMLRIYLKIGKRGKEGDDAVNMWTGALASFGSAEEVYEVEPPVLTVRRILA